MRKTLTAALAVSTAIALAGLVTHLDGLCAIGVIATWLVFCWGRLTARDRVETRAATAASAIAFAIEAVLSHRHPEAPFAALMGVATWKLCVAGTCLSLLDAAGLFDRMHDWAERQPGV